MPKVTRLLRFLPLALVGLVGFLALNPVLLKGLESPAGFAALVGLIAASGYAVWRMALSQHRTDQMP